MAHGTPVLTSNASSLQEVFSQAALLVNPEHVFDIARGIRQILTEGVLREALIRRGYEPFGRHSWERFAPQVRQAPEAVMAGGSAPQKDLRITLRPLGGAGGT